MKRLSSFRFLAGCLLVTVVSNATAEDQKNEKDKEAPPRAYPYPLDTCVVSGKKLSSDPDCPLKPVNG